jgi:hypothetical protein
MACAGLAWLAQADVASLPAGVQADCLRGLEQAAAMHLAARSSVLSAFAAAAGYEDDGHGSARTWLKWQTRVSTGAAAAAMGWARRQAAHPAVGRALAAGAVSGSWARQVCDWTDLLPEARRGEADVLLLAAAAGGAELADLAELAEEMRRRSAGPDTDGDRDGFEDRQVRLDTTFGGAGRLDGDLTPGCAAALAAVLDALGGKHGPEDVRTARQRHHDAVEEMCRRLIAAGCLPERAGQPTHILLHMTLDQLRGQPGAAAAETTWAGTTSGPGRDGGPGGPAAAGRWPAAGPGDDCDAAIIPVVCGHADTRLLNQLAAALLRPGPGQHPGPATASTPGPASPPPPGSREAARRGRAERAARDILLARAADLMSGPGGLAAYLRTRIPDHLAASVSLPLDIGTRTDTIPVHLRRAVATRDRKCRFPGCDQAPAACQPHHIIPRSRGGPTSLANLTLLCTFHHLIAVHRWGWGIVLHPDGTLTATSPDKQRTLRSHSPPASTA